MPDQPSSTDNENTASRKKRMLRLGGGLMVLALLAAVAGLYRSKQMNQGKGSAGDVPMMGCGGAPPTSNISKPRQVLAKKRSALELGSAKDVTKTIRVCLNK